VWNLGIPPTSYLNDAGQIGRRRAQAMIIFVLLALVFAAVVAAAGVVIGTLALALRAVVWIVFFPIRLIFSFLALPILLGGLALMVVAVVGASILGALFVGLGVLLAAAFSVALPLGLVFGACWLIARLMRRPALAKVV
jgi:hypothetical protein